MPWWQASDTHHDDPIWATLAEGRPDVVDRLQAAWGRLMSLASRQRSDGYLTSWAALAQCHNRKATLEALCSRPLADMPALVHRPGDECDCLDEDWRQGYELRLHGFLKRNPSRRENDRETTQRRERDDPRIRNDVYMRDGGCCRYCGSGPMPRKGMGRAKDGRRKFHLDHVDPDRVAGPDLGNLAASCGRCNQEKSRRTPEEAGMILRPVPSPERAAALLARDEELHDLPVVTLADLARARSGDAVDNDNDNDLDNAPTTVEALSTSLSPPLSSPLSGPVDVDVGDGPSTATTTGQPCPQPATDVARQPAGQSPSCPGSGGVGHPVSCQCQPGVSGASAGAGPPGAGVGGQPARGPLEPDIYHRRTRR